MLLPTKLGPNGRLEYSPSEATDLAEKLFENEQYFQLVDDFLGGKMTASEFLQGQLALTDVLYEAMLERLDEALDEHEDGI